MKGKIASDQKSNKKKNSGMEKEGAKKTRNKY